MSTAATSTHGASTNFAAESKSLLLLLPPISVLVLAGIVFELVAFDLYQLRLKIPPFFPDSAAMNTALILRESQARYVWCAGLLLNVMADLAVITICIRILLRPMSRRGRQLYTGLCALFCLGSLGNLAASMGSDSAFSAIFYFTYDNLEASGRFEQVHLGAIRWSLVSLNAMSAVAPIIAMFAACRTMVSRAATAEDGLHRMAEQMRRMKELLNLGSALLVLGIVHMNAWLRWPAALVADPGIASDINGLSLSVSLFWGAAFTLMIIAFYLPAALLLRQRASALLAETGSPDSVMTWLKDHGLSLSPAEQMPQLAAMLAPLLAGPVGSALGNLG